MALPTDAQFAVQAAAPAGGRSLQLIVPIHREIHPVYGLVEVTPERVAAYAANFVAGVKTYNGLLPFTIEHDDEQGAAGWIHGVEARPDGLYADISWTPKGVEAIHQQTFPFISPQWLDHWTDPVTGSEYQDVLEGASLVVRPEFRDLPPAVVKQFSEAHRPVIRVIERGPLEDDMDDQAATTAAVAEGAGVTATTPAPAAAVQMSEPVIDAKTFAEQSRKLAELERRDAVRTFGEQLGGYRLGEARHPLTPVCREAGAELAADIAHHDPALAKRFAEYVGGLTTWPGTGEVGHADQPAAAKQFSEADAIVAAQFGLTPEEMS